MENELSKTDQPCTIHSVKRIDVINSSNFRIESSELCDKILAGFNGLGVDTSKITSHEELILKILRRAADEYSSYA